MVKVKNKRNAGAADKANQKRKAEANKKKLNPFEVHINRQKHQVLGKKSKHDRGLPGVSRAKAVQKRKETLGAEMKLMHKTNTFIDKRIGEKNSELSAEDRMVARFAAERAKQHSRKNIYNLADDEVLTHRGQTLEQIEKFDDPRSDEEDEGGFKGLDDDFVSEGHFGGGVLSKSDKDGAKSHKDLIEQLIAESKKRKAEKQQEREKTLDLTEKLDNDWKDLQPVVFKRYRVEEPEESAIDKVLGKTDKNSMDYDKMMRELRFEKRGTPSDAIKTDKKKEEEEQLRIAQLERERNLRMQADYEPKKTQAVKHRSADALEDNFVLDDEKEFMLAYDKDGKPLVPDHILKDYSVPNSEPKFDGGISESSEDEDEEHDKNDDDEECEDNEEGKDSDKSDEESDKVESKSKDKPKNVKEKSILFQNSDSSEEDSGDDSNPDDKTVKLAKSVISKEKEIKVKKLVTREKSSEASESGEDSKSGKDSESGEDSDSNEESKPKTSKVVSNSKSSVKNNEKAAKSSSDDCEDEDNKNDDSGDESDEESVGENITEQTVDKKKVLKQDSESREDSREVKTRAVKQNVEKKQLKKNKRKKLIGDSDSDEKGEESGDDEDLKPFLGKTTDYDNLKKLLTGKTPSQQSTALQKLIKSYDPSLGENNKELLSQLFANMLQYVNDLFTNLKDVGKISKSFSIMESIAPYFYDIALINRVSTRKYFAELLTEKHNQYQKKPKKVPDMDTIIFFKLVSNLYPTSDFRHPITTPCLTFMSEILSTGRFQNARSISRGLFVCTLISEYTALSKRFVPAAINFIRGILFLSAKTTILNLIKPVPPFRLHKDTKVLILEDDCSKLDFGIKMTLKDLVTDSIDNGFKIRTLLVAVILLKGFFDNCNVMEAQECIFEPHLKLLSRLELELYPKRVSSNIEGIIKYMKGALELKTYTPLSSGKPKPKMLRLYEPDVQEFFTGSKSSKLSREMAERQRLEHKCKREMKGALREIRRDKAFIASVKIKDRIKGDKIRKDKVKQIYKDASIQQGELNKLKRGK